MRRAALLIAVAVALAVLAVAQEPPGPPAQHPTHAPSEPPAEAQQRADQPAPDSDESRAPAATPPSHGETVDGSDGDRPHQPAPPSGSRGVESGAPEVEAADDDGTGADERATADGDEGPAASDEEASAAEADRAEEPSRTTRAPSRSEEARGLGIQVRAVDIKLDVDETAPGEGAITEDTEDRVEQAEGIRAQVSGLRDAFQTDANLAIAAVRQLEGEVMDVNQAITRAARVPTQLRRGRMSETQARDEIASVTEVTPRLREILEELDAKEQDAADLRLYYDNTLRELEAKRNHFAASTKTYQSLSDSLGTLEAILSDVDRLAETVHRTREEATDAIDRIGQVATDIDAAIRESQAQALRERVDEAMRVGRGTPARAWSALAAAPRAASEMGYAVSTGITRRGGLGYGLAAASLVTLIAGLWFRRPLASLVLSRMGPGSEWREHRLRPTGAVVGGLAVVIGASLFGVASDLVEGDGLWVIVSAVCVGGVFILCGLGEAALVEKPHREKGQLALARSRLLLVVLGLGIPALRHLWVAGDLPHDVAVVAVVAYALLALGMLTHALLRDTTPLHVFSPDSWGRRLQRAVKPLAAVVAVAGLGWSLALLLGYENMAEFVGRAVPLSLGWVLGGLVAYRLAAALVLRVAAWLRGSADSRALVRRNWAVLGAVAVTIAAALVQPVLYAWKLFLLADNLVSFLVIIAGALWPSLAVARFVWPRALRTVYPTETRDDTERRIVDLMEEPAGVLFFALFTHLTPRTFTLPVDLTAQASVWAAWIAGLGVTFLLMRSVDLTVYLMSRHRTDEPSTLHDQLLPMLRKVANGLIVVFALIVAAQKAGLNVTALLGGLGVGGLAVALAGQETIANVFGAAMIFVDRPFKVGDWILVGDVEGTVEEIGLRSTRIRTFGKTLVTMPNAELANKVIDNFSQMPVRRVKMTVGLSYETSAADMDAALRSFERILEAHPDVWQDFKLVAFTDLGGHSLDVMVYYFTRTTVWADYLRIRGEVNMMIMEAIDRLGLEIAFPTSTLYVRPDERPSPRFRGMRPRRSERRSIGADAGNQAAAYLGSDASESGRTGAVRDSEEPVLGELSEDDGGR